MLLPYDFRKYGFQLFSFHLRQKKPKTTHQAKKPHKNPSCFLLLSHLSHRVPKAVFAVAMLLKPGFLGKTRRAEAWFLQILLLYANVQTVAALAHAFVCTSCSAGFACAKWLALTLLRPGNCSACSIAFLLAIQHNTFLISISTFYLFRNLHKKFNIFYTFFFFLASFFRKQKIFWIHMIMVWRLFSRHITNQKSSLMKQLSKSSALENWIIFITKIQANGQLLLYHWCFALFLNYIKLPLTENISESGTDILHLLCNMWVVLNRLVFFHCSKLTIYWIYIAYTIKFLFISRKDSGVTRLYYETV